jgi:iron complex transport system substrate-binding protein
MTGFPWRRSAILSALLLAAAGLASFARGEPAQKPRRIVSINLCTDQILLDVVSHDRIAALSFIASDPSMSLRAAEAEHIKKVQGAAEEVLALDPDLIIAGEYSTPAAVSLLERLGRRVVKVPLASTFEEIRSVVRQIAEATGDSARGREIISQFDRRLAMASNLSQRPVFSAVAVQVNSLAAGPGSLIDEVFKASGLRNAAADYALGPGGRLPLETLIVSPPDLIVFANAPSDFRTVLGDNLRHPAMEYAAKRQRSVHLPMTLWLCGTPEIAKAVEQLREARSAIEREHRP